MFYGDLPTETIKQLSANKIFVGSMGVSINNGLTHPVIEEIPVLKALMKISQRKYLITDYSKFGKASLAKIADLKDFDAFIVDDAFPELYREYAEMHNIDII